MRIAVVPACIAIILGSACAPTTTFVETSDYQAVPKESGSDVEVFQTRPTRRFVESGMLEGHQGLYDSAEKVIPAMREEAARRGCDAIIVTGSADDVSGTTYEGTGSVGTRKGYRGVCIMWADGEEVAARQWSGKVSKGDAGAIDTEGPDGVAGFTFKAAPLEVEAACTGAGFTWSNVRGSVYRCSGQPAKTGIGEDVRLRFVQDKLAAILLESRPNGPWLPRFTKLKTRLEAKYGEATADSQIPGSCVSSLRACVEEGRAHASAKWAWQSGRTIRLSMEKGRKSDEAAIRLVYSIDVDATDTPIEDDAL